MKELNCLNKRVLIIPDTHCPYQHKDWLQFLRTIRDTYLAPYDIILHLGDEVDSHAISFHDSDADLPSAGDELIKAINDLHGLQDLFPNMYICDSNHGSLAVRRFKHHGIPLRYLKSLADIYGTPKWVWHEHYMLNTKLGPIYVCHGKASPYGKLAKEMGCSAIQGHFHGKFEVTWHNSMVNERFNLFSGCLIDRESMAFAYGKNHIPKPILGATVISKHGYPRLIKMGLNINGRWDKRLPDKL